MANKQEVKQFSFAVDDPLAAEHKDVAAWVEEALALRGDHDYYQEVDLKSLSNGQKLLSATPAEARRYVMAAVAQTAYWDQAAEKLQRDGTSSHTMRPEWPQIWGPRRQAAASIAALIRRALPFQEGDFLAVLNWCCASDNLSTHHFPLSHLNRALERYAKNNALSSALREAMALFASRLRSSQYRDSKRFATKVEQLCGASPEATGEATSTEERQPPPQPAPAGSPAVLDQLKRWLGLPAADEAPSTLLEPDRFALRDDSLLRDEHEWVSSLLNETLATGRYRWVDIMKTAAWQAMLSRDPAAKGRLVLAAAERHVNAQLAALEDSDERAVWQSRHAAGAVVASFATFFFILSRDELFDFLLYLSARAVYEKSATQAMIARNLEQVEKKQEQVPLSEGERFVLALLRVSMIAGPPLGIVSADVTRITQWIGDGAAFCLAPGEVWSDAINDDFTRMNLAQRKNWVALFTHMLGATASRPSAKWLNTAKKLIETIGGDEVQQAIEKWLPLVSQGQSVQKLGEYSGDVIHEENATCLRGLLWTVQLLPNGNELARLVTNVAISAYKKVPGIGPRAVKVGNACVYALSAIPTKEAVGQLALLKVRVRFGTAQKEVEKAFDAAAAALDLPRDEVEEIGVPTYGLTEVGLRRKNLGEYCAEVIVTGSNAELLWFDAKEKPLKSVPAKVKSEHKEDLDDLRQSLKDIQAMLPAQRDRIDSMFLRQVSWPIETWRERYLDHALVGTIARRLLWNVDGTPATFISGDPTDVRGNRIEHGRTAEISLWHPVGHRIDDITAWRRRLEELNVVQPFKQAHREVYLLTDAEQNTRTYSNRFAAHIIRQHQFNALCAARGWKNKLRLMVDDVYPPATKELPHWGLRAEFWIEGVGDGYGTDTNESGVYMLLSTDQVRFYRTEAAQNLVHAGGGAYESSAAGPGQANVNEPISLDEVPPLVFSEVMRDVDLFVGVASVGNDPTWQDGGPAGRYRDYWQSYSFGELSGTATTRKQVLERLIPRLKIADRCSFSERFLVVRGDLRTYKIHLGSGNILMEPNDQYLCIVADSRSRSRQDDLFLPFDGDGALSIIISKALLLAEDTKIKDPTIVRQINYK